MQNLQDYGQPFHPQEPGFDPDFDTDEVPEVVLPPSEIFEKGYGIDVSGADVTAVQKIMSGSLRLANASFTSAAWSAPGHF